MFFLDFAGFWKEAIMIFWLSNTTCKKCTPTHTNTKYPKMKKGLCLILDFDGSQTFALLLLTKTMGKSGWHLWPAFWCRQKNETSEKTRRLSVVITNEQNLITDGAKCLFKSGRILKTKVVQKMMHQRKNGCREKIPTLCKTRRREIKSARQLIFSR